MIRGQKSKAVPQEINIDAKLHNRFDFEVIDSVTGEVKQRAYAENIILNKWWSQTLGSTYANGYIHIGTGSGTLAPTRTALFTFLSGKASTESVTTVNEEENWMSHKRVATWIETENIDTVWTEVGIAYGTSSTNLTTHALIKDLNGNPVTLSKGTTDIINVYSTVYAYLPAPADGVRFNYPRQATVNFSNYAFLAWLVGMTGRLPIHRTFALKGDLQYNQSGYSGSWTGSLPLAYDTAGTEIPLANGVGDATAKTLTVTVPRFPAASFNGAEGIKSIAFGIVSFINGTRVCTERLLDLQLTVPATWYPYSPITGETVGTGDGATLGFSTLFPFLMDDSSFVLKRNGAVIDPGTYTVSYGEPNGSNLLPHFKVIDYYSSYFSIGCPNSHVANSNDNLPIFVIFENPFYDKFPISNFALTYGNIYASDSPDGPWTQVTLSSGNVPAQYQSSRYWKVVPTSSYNGVSLLVATSDVLAAKKNITFTTAPASGDVITADYHCGVITKNANNVFDLTLVISLQEKDV